MFAIVGLGNPGKKYHLTRHNVGFQVTNLLAGDAASWRAQGKCQLTKCSIGTHEVLLIQPQLFMNKSGEAIRPLVDFYKIEPSELIVIYDELDLDTGTIRLRQGGSAGGHRGLADILRHYADANFYRIRVGIGHPRRRAEGEPESFQEVSDYVLGSPRGEEKKLLDDACTRAAKAAALLVESGLSEAQQRFHPKD